jgi:hypothetical protein
LLFGLPRLLSEIIRRAIDKEADMVVVGVADQRRRTLDLTRVDVIVTAYDDQSVAVRMLRDRPGVRVFALAAHGKESLLYELRPHRVTLGEVSPGELIVHIRAGRSDEAVFLGQEVT